jgi:hypothetical protein
MSRGGAATRQMPHAAPRMLRLAHLFRGFRFAGTQRVRVDVRRPNSGRTQKPSHDYNQTKITRVALQHLSSFPFSQILPNWLLLQLMHEACQLRLQSGNFHQLRDTTGLTAFDAT